MWNEGDLTFTAGEDLEAARRVKIESGTTTTPPEVVYADAGEDWIGVTRYAVSDGDKVVVRPKNFAGSYEIECLIDSAIAHGATLYGADDGRVSDAVSGAPQGLSMAAAGADYEHIECFMWNLKGTTIPEKMIPIPLTQLRESDATNIPAAAAHYGVLGQDSTPILDYANGDTDSALRLAWAASNSDPIVFQTPLPPDIDTGQDLTVHFRAAMAGTTDTPTIASDAYFNEGDTKVEDASAAVTGATYAEYTITIAAADIPSGAQTVTVELTPGAHTTDILYLTALWLEYLPATS